MGTFVARPRRALPWLLVTVLSGICLGACSGGSSTGDSSPVGSVPGPSGPVASDTVVGLAWQPNSDPVAGYLVYYGPTPTAAKTLAVQLSLSAIGAQAPNISFNAGRDLSLTVGETVCFRLRAYDSANMLSDWSESACVTI